jgi:hypothetical protein
MSDLESVHTAELSAAILRRRKRQICLVRGGRTPHRRPCRRDGPVRTAFESSTNDTARLWNPTQDVTDVDIDHDLEDTIADLLTVWHRVRARR